MRQSQKSGTWRLLIEGRVQGVGYRRFTQKVASRQRLCGWVRNLSDGRVEVRVCATSEQLEGLMRELRKGPMHGNVRDIQSESLANEILTGFEILEDG